MNAPMDANNAALNSQIDAFLGQIMPKANRQFRARLANQMAQLVRHGNFAETVIRTTPEGTDMINFSRLWEYVLMQADRQTRGYVAKSSRDDFEQTRKDFEDCASFMVAKLKDAIERHNLDLTGTNFISRVAQRYDIADKKRKAPQEAAPAPAPAKAAAAPAAAPEPAPAVAEKPSSPAEAPIDKVEGL